jgi:DNA-binding winged helix-turn-helix (wHTH) protein
MSGQRCILALPFTPSDCFNFGPWCWQRHEQVLLRAGRPVALGSRAREILALLLEEPGALVTNERIVARVWRGTFVVKVAVRVHIAQLRRVLREDLTCYVQNVRGIGYRIAVPSVLGLEAPADTCSPCCDVTSMTDGNVLQFGPFRWLPGRRLLLKSGEPVRMNPRVAALLSLLLERPGVLVLKKEIQRRIWPTTAVRDATLRGHILALRKVLQAGLPGPDCVQNVVGYGYRFVLPMSGSPRPAGDAPRVKDKLPGAPVTVPVRVHEAVASAPGTAKHFDTTRAPDPAVPQGPADARGPGQPRPAFDPLDPSDGYTTALVTGTRNINPPAALFSRRAPLQS